MRTRIVLIAVRTLALLCSPISVSTAGAADNLSAPPTLIRLDSSPLDQPNVLSTAVNHCVALVNARELGAAAPVCDTAVSAARRERVDLWSSAFGGSRAVNQDLAIAYNNRAVLRYLSGQLSLATEDAARAIGASRTPATESTASAIQAAVRRRATAEAVAGHDRNRNIAVGP